MKLNDSMILVIVAIIAIILVLWLMKCNKNSNNSTERYSFGASSNISEPLMDDINNPTYNG